MSLILEALKKSEANRRLGQAPDLGTPIASTRRERSPMWALLVVVLALGAGFWWWFDHTSPAPTPSPAAPAAAVASTPTSIPHKPVARSAPAFKPAPQMQPAGASGFGPLPPDAPRRPEQMQQQDQRIFQAGRRRANSARTLPAHTAERTPPARIRSEPVSAAPAVTPRAHAPKTEETRGYTTPVPAAHPQAPAQLSHPTATTAPTTTDAPSYYELPFATRKALPQLKLSMHVYAVDPKQRFVILNDTRMIEGDTTPDNVTLREIAPDGVVLEFQGKRFFYPRDGL